ncbi:MAG: signal peptide peptidase SppA [candidate division Zixibacteria bacterium]|nr:signal peptide peptidase SppA [candidate division Zixibacteria bacterium]
MAVSLSGLSEPESSDGIGFGGFGRKIAVIDLIGEIESSKSVVQQLRRWGDDRSVPAILLRVDSPGGGVAASQEIHEEILRVREKGKRVVVSMGAVAASGGLYVAVAADTIVANPGTLTGSIGVIFQFPTLERLLDKLGVRYETVKSGQFKDIGNLARTMTPPEQQVLQTVIDDTYDQFVHAVAEGRRLEPDTVKAFADGRIFTGRQAKNMHLVDVLGDYNDALDVAADMVGMQKPPKTVKEIPVRSRGLRDLIGETFVSWLLGSGTDDNRSAPSLQYKYQ